MTQRRAVVIVAASPLVAAGLRSALADDGSLFVASTVDAAAAIGRHAGVAVDAVVAVATDARDALSLHRTLAGRVPLVLLGDALPPSRPTGGDHAAVALLPALAGAEQVRAAVRAVLAGLHAWSSGALPNGPDAFAPAHARRDEVAAEPPGEPLTPRELEVFELLAKGLSNRDIAAALGISAHTAKFHVGQILAKIGAATRAEAVALGLRLGLIGV